MKIQYCSDLHLEFPQNSKFMEEHPLIPAGEVLILAGDILPFELHKSQKAFIDFVADNFEMVCWIPGNHEYYGYDVAKIPNPLNEKLRSNVWLLNNQVVTFNSVRFICSTLWSKINVANALDIQRNISDFFSISWQGKKFTTGHFNQLHSQSVGFLEKALKEIDVKKSIVITHHVPTLFNYPSKYRNSPLNDAFATELYDLIHDSGARYWIYGHHHCNVPEFKVGQTTLLTNQMGYVQLKEEVGFKENAVIDV